MEEATPRIGVLLAGDVLLSRAALRCLVTGLGFAVIGEAGSLEEAVQLVRNSAPDIALIDLDSSFDTTALVEELASSTGGTRVVVLTDRSRAAGHVRLVELGASGLVLKNDPPEILEKAIHKVHAGEVWLDRTTTAEVLTRMAKRRREEDVEGAKIEALTPREHEIVALIGEGLKNAAIARRLFISEATVRNHLTSIFEKLELSDRFELAVYAYRHGLVSPPHPSSRRTTAG